MKLGVVTWRPVFLTIIPHVPKVIYIFRRTNGRHEEEKGLDVKGCAGMKKILL
jgi:hypothetical protein